MLKATTIQERLWELRKDKGLGKAPRRQLACPDGNCYGTPGNIFINQLYRLLSGGHLGTKCLEVPSIVPHAPY